MGVRLLVTRSPLLMGRSLGRQLLFSVVNVRDAAQGTCDIAPDQ